MRFVYATLASVVNCVAAVAALARNSEEHDVLHQFTMHPTVPRYILEQMGVEETADKDPDQTRHRILMDALNYYYSSMNSSIDRYNRKTGVISAVYPLDDYYLFRRTAEGAHYQPQWDRNHSRHERAFRITNRRRQQVPNEDYQDSSQATPQSTTLIDESSVGDERAYTTNYQSAPLLQGYGTHYVTAWIGQPPQRQTLIVDSGSHLTAFPCKGCHECGEDLHTDQHFDPTLSQSLEVPNCQECTIGASCVIGATDDVVHAMERCEISQAYTEGSSWTAYQATDSFFLGGPDPTTAPLDSVDRSYAIDFTFHCQISETGLFVTQLADGIMGMSAHPDTIVPQMVKQKKLLHNMFSLCFKNELAISKDGVVAGVMTLGGIDERLHDSPMVYAKHVREKDEGGWYTVYVKNIYLMEGADTEDDFEASVMLPQSKVNTNQIHPLSQHSMFDLGQINSGKGVIVDSGTTDTYLSISLKRPFEEMWSDIMSKRGRESWTGYHNDAIKLTNEDIMALPTVLIQLQAYDSMAFTEDLDSVPGLTGFIDVSSPADILLAIPPTHYLEYSPSKDTYTSRLYFTESTGGVIGANSMQGHDILLDWENGRVGFAKSTCSNRQLGMESNEEAKILENEGAVVGAEGVVVDCTLGTSTVALSCTDSVKDEIDEYCATDKEHVLHGIEKLARVIETDATSAGKSCEEVARASLKGRDATVECKEEGVCFETRPCSLPCSSPLVEYQLQIVEAPPGDEIGEDSGQTQPCGDNLFGACQSSCIQSKIVSVLMNDGQCHATGDVITRPCHIDDCGRSNPCVVPFVVHCIFGFGGNGGETTMWDKTHEEVFASALAGTLRETVADDAMQIMPGDVKVLMVSRWIEGGELEAMQGNAGEELGSKIVAEISVFNTGLLPSGKGEKQSSVSCREEDLYAFSQLALKIHSALQDELFLQNLLSFADKIGQETSETTSLALEPLKAPFAAVDARRSKLLTSWTIKTEVGSGDPFRAPTSGENDLWHRISDPEVAAFCFAVILFLLSVGVYCGYKIEERRDMALIESGRRHYSKLINRMRARQSAESKRGTYAQIATADGADEGDENLAIPSVFSEDDDDEVEEKDIEGDIEFA